MWAIKHWLGRIRWHDGRFCPVVVHDVAVLKLTDKQQLSSYEVRTPWLQLILQRFQNLIPSLELTKDSNLLYLKQKCYKAITRIAHYISQVNSKSNSLISKITIKFRYWKKKHTHKQCTPLLLRGMGTKLKKTIQSNLTSCKVAMGLN